MTAGDDVDLTILPRFLAHLEPRAGETAQFARRLLAAEWTVQSIFGPVQMDVWELCLRRNSVVVRFGIERGIADGVLVGAPDDDLNRLGPLRYAVLGWARACGADVPLDDPDEFWPSYLEYGEPALDWLLAGNHDVFRRILAARKAYHARRYSRDQRLGDEWLAATNAWGIRLLEAGAAPRPAELS